MAAQSIKVSYFTLHKKAFFLKMAPLWLRTFISRIRLIVGTFISVLLCLSALMESARFTLVICFFRNSDVHYYITRIKSNLPYIIKIASKPGYRHCTYKFKF